MPAAGDPAPDRLDPWASRQFADYDRLIRQFGIDRFDPAGLPSPSKLFRRGVVFGQRGFDYITKAIQDKRPFGVLTGLMPSGPMHLGHKMVLDQVLYFQSLGADVTILVADLEAYATRGLSLAKCRDIAIDSYIRNYVALGLRPERCQIYFQSQRKQVTDLAFLLSKKVTWSTMRAIYGFKDEVNLAHVQSPLIQMGDILHGQLPAFGGPRPILVPVGVDQDPHLRLTRDIAAAHRLLSLQPTKEGHVGVFVKGDYEGSVDRLLGEARAALEGIGFSRFTENVPYRALYVEDASPARIVDMDFALVPVESRHGEFVFLPPASSYHRFETGLTGGKMSSSIPESHIALLDGAKDVERKILTAKTGGGATREEHRKNGGRPDECAVYETFVYHLSDDDTELRRIHDECKAGTWFCGECKGLAKERLQTVLAGIHSKRDEAGGRLDEYIRSA